MNCVATPAVDEQRRSEVQRDSDPHGLRLESILRRKGLRDAFRLLHGREAKGCTRVCETVSRRLDRLYVPAHESLL